MDTESLEHLANHLVGALNQNLHWPPLIVCHVIQEPFTSCLWCIELFCQKLHPLHHSWLKHHVRVAEIQIYKMYLINNLQLHHEDIFILITGFHASALCQGMGIFSGPWFHFSFNPSRMSVLLLLQLNVCLCPSRTVWWLPVLIYLFNMHNDTAHYTSMDFKNVTCKQYNDLNTFWIFNLHLLLWPPHYYQDLKKSYVKVSKNWHIIIILITIIIISLLLKFNLSKRKIKLFYTVIGISVKWALCINNNNIM